MGQMTDYLWSLLPPWLAKPRGKGFAKGFGQIGDEFQADVVFGVKEAMIEECTNDALTSHLRNSNLQAVDGEPFATTRNVLRQRWEIWRGGGGYDTMVNALARLGFPNAAVYSTAQLAVAGHASAFGTYLGFFFVAIAVPNVFRPADLWHGGDEWHDPIVQELWGLDGITRENLEGIFYTIRKFKPATSSCRYLFLEFPDATTIVIPVHERWELQPNGAYRMFYNKTYTTP